MKLEELKASVKFILLDDVLKFYASLGYNIEDEDEEVPNVLPMDGKEHFFTGDLLRLGDTFAEIVLVADAGFNWSDVESDMDDDDEDDDN